MITRGKGLLTALTLGILLASNILTLTNTAFNTTLSGLLGTALGVRTVSGAMQAKLAGQDRKIRQQAVAQGRRQAATRRFGNRLAMRTKRVAAKSIAAIPAESVPFIGLAVLIADTGYELYAACQTMQDLDALYAELGLQDAAAADTMQSVCKPDLPAVGEVWNGLFAEDAVGWGQQGAR